MVYSGVSRTPLSALVQHVPLENSDCPVAAEFFATTLDIYLLLDDIAEDPEKQSDSQWTACNKAMCTSSTGTHLLLRSNRTFVRRSNHHCSTYFSNATTTNHNSNQQSSFQHERPLPASDHFWGGGSFLAKQIIENHPTLQALPLVSISEMFAPAVAKVAPAYAIAQLAEERIGLLNH